MARAWLRRRKGRRVIVHCLPPSDQSIEGLLTLVARDGLVLQGARFLEANAPAAGEVFVPRDRVAFVQYQP